MGVLFEDTVVLFFFGDSTTGFGFGSGLHLFIKKYRPLSHFNVCTRDKAFLIHNPNKYKPTLSFHFAQTHSS